MFLFDIDEQEVQKIIELLTGIECSELVALWVARILLWILIIIALLAALYKWVLIPKLKKNEYIRNHVDSGYAEHLFSKASKYYINTCFQNIPPSNFPDMMDSIRSVSSQDMIKKYLNDILVESNSDSPLYCVLGGSGMGKTSFLINLLKTYVRKYRIDQRPYDIELVNLAGENFHDKISSINQPRNTILLLDAIDENPQAVSNYDTFIDSLERDIESFPIVVLTCRTQFFPDEEHEPKQSKLRNNGRKKGFYAYTRHYISPFSDNDVEKYLWKKYFLKFKKIRNARKIVQQCTSFTHRPLLLSFIDVLLDAKRDYSSLLDIYETLIEKWLDREATTDDNPSSWKLNMMQLLQKAAVRMYYNFQTAGYYMESEELNNMLSECNLSHMQHQFKGRSLLNRDALGLWKFSHKSFLEFFLAKEYFEKEDFSLDFSNLDVSLTLYREFCSREISKYLEQNKIQLSKSHALIPENDVIKVISGSDFNIKYIEPFDNIRILEIDAKMFHKVEPYLECTNIYYIKITNYSLGTTINGILKYPQIKYVSVNGSNCSKTFIKEAARQSVAVLNNGELYNYEADVKDNNDVPIDFHSALYINYPLPFLPFGGLFNRE